MASLCHQCGRPNPLDAVYCYFDGFCLSRTGAAQPLDLSQQPFPAPFCFSSGSVCQNFDQLVLACERHWGEAQELLCGGEFEQLLTRLGRTDLVIQLQAAVAQFDPEQALDLFLTKLPCRNLNAPKLATDLIVKDLGQLQVRRDADFELPLENRGHRLIVGTVGSDRDWLHVEGAPVGHERLIQFHESLVLKIKIDGAKLRAALNPLVGHVNVKTTGGNLIISVTVVVPIVPFDFGALAGCRTPRELALKARSHPKEAIEALCGEHVLHWYEANGWGYPIQGPHAFGVAVIQQFFETLGLAKAPAVVLKTKSLQFQGAVGRTLERTIEFEAAEKKPVFALSSSSDPWLKVGPLTRQGTSASISVEAVVPDSPGTILDGRISIQTNGGKNFAIPVQLIVQGSAVRQQRREPVLPPKPPAPLDPPPRRRIWPYALCSAIALLLAGAGWLGLRNSSAQPAAATNVLANRLSLLPPHSYLAMSVKIAELHADPTLKNDVAKLQVSLNGHFDGLELQPPNLCVHSLFAASTKNGTFRVWTFAAPVKIGAISPGYFVALDGADKAILLNQFERTQAWATDADGHLLSGHPDELKAVLEQVRKKAKSPSFDRLMKATATIEPTSLLWLAGDLTAGQPIHQFDWLAPLGDTCKISELQCTLIRALEPNYRLLVKTRFPSEDDYRAFAKALEGGFAENRFPTIPHLRPNLQPRQVLANINVKQLDASLLATELDLDDEQINHLLSTVAKNVTSENVDLRKRRTLSVQAALKIAADHLVAERDEQAILALKECAAQFPYDSEVRKTRDNAMEMHGLVTKLKGHLSENNLQAAEKTLQAADRLTLFKPRHDAFRRDLDSRKEQKSFDIAIELARAALAKKQFALARDHYLAAQKVSAKDPLTKLAATGADALHDCQDALLGIRDGLAKKKFAAVHDQSKKALADLGAPSLVWEDKAFAKHREPYRQELTLALRTAHDGVVAAAEDSLTAGDALFHDKKYRACVEQYEAAIKSLEAAQQMAEEFLDFDASAKALVQRVNERMTKVKRSTAKANDTLIHVEVDAELNAIEKGFLDAVASARAIAPLKDRIQNAVRRLEYLDDRTTRDAAALKERANKSATKLERLGRPVGVDFTKGDELPVDWKFEKKKWAVKNASDGGWLQALDVKDAILTTSDEFWPTAFTFNIDVSLHDRNGQIDNTNWKFAEDPLVVTLVGKMPSQNVELRLGRDPIVPNQQVLRLAIGRTSKSVNVNDIKKASPIRLKLCYDNGFIVFVNDREIFKTFDQGPFCQIRLTVPNEQRAAGGGLFGSPIIHRISVQSAP